jgi:hypothetical protein
MMIIDYLFGKEREFTSTKNNILNDILFETF